MPFQKSKIFDTVKTSLYLSYSDKKHYIETSKVRDANDLRLGMENRYILHGQENKPSKNLIELSDYSVDNSATSEYDYIRFKINHYHSHKFDKIDNLIRFTEEFGYRTKDWDDFDGTGNDRDEDTYYLKVKAATA